jgi:hypothetical protein
MRSSTITFSRVKHFFIVTAGIVFTFLLSAVHATEPCVPQTESRFSESVVKPSTLVVKGIITDFSKAEEGVADHWTKLKPEIALLGSLPSYEITIYGWQAFQPPSFRFERGQHILVFLQGEKNQFSLTNQNWEECVPSLQTLNDKEEVCPTFKGIDQKFQKRCFGIDAYRKYLNSTK